MTLSQHLRELAGKATPGPFQSDRDLPHNRMPRVHGGDGSLICVVGNMGTTQDQWEANAALIALMLNNLPAILSALDLQERLGKVETVEVVARAIMDHVCRDGQDFEWSEKFMMWPEKAVSEVAQAAINALKGGAA